MPCIFISSDAYAALVFFGKPVFVVTFVFLCVTLYLQHEKKVPKRLALFQVISLLPMKQDLYKILSQYVAWVLFFAVLRPMCL